MSSLFKKLNLKDQTEIWVINSPASFAGELAALQGIKVTRDLKQAGAVHFAIGFACKQGEVDALAKTWPPRPWETRFYGSLIRRRPPRNFAANSTGIPVGKLCGALGSTRCGRSQLMRIGLRCVSDAWNLSENNREKRQATVAHTAISRSAVDSPPSPTPLRERHLAGVRDEYGQSAQA